MNNKYLNFLNWAVFTMIDRKTQDDHKSKIQVCGLFRSPVLAEESFYLICQTRKLNGICSMWTIWSGSKSFIISSRILTRNTVITQYFMLKMEISQLTKKTNSAICFIFGQIQKLEGLTCFEN